MVQTLLSADNISNVGLGRRLGEILTERGKAYSILAFSKKTGVDYYHLYRCITKNNQLEPDEIKRVAKGLGITVERLKQTDTKKDRQKVREIIEKQTNFTLALNLSMDMLSKAMGWTERFDILNDMGRVYFYLKRYEEAHATWLEAYKYAKTIREQHRENERLHIVVNNLLMSYTLVKDFVNMFTILSEAGDEFKESKPRRAASLAHAIAMFAYNVGDMERYRTKMEEALSYGRLTNDPFFTATSERNFAYVEYQFGNYLRSKELYENALRIFSELSSVTEFRLVTIKDYCKTLLELKLRDKALTCIETSLHELSSVDLPSLRAKFLLLRADIKGEPQDAELVLGMAGVGSELKHLACHFLMKYSNCIEDMDSLSYYYKEAEKYSSKSALYNKEGF